MIEEWLIVRDGELWYESVMGKEEGWRRWRSGGVCCLGRRSAGLRLALAMGLARRWIVMLQDGAEV
jgi:hypothetical protein